MDRVVDIADMAVTSEDDTSLVTYSLGSCIGLAIWDPVAKVGGLLHYMLPEGEGLTREGQDQSGDVRRHGHPTVVPRRL